jgi:hypothetical protein
MKKLVALVAVLPRLAWAGDSSSNEPWADESLREVIEASLAPPTPLPDSTPEDTVEPETAPDTDDKSAPSTLSYGGEVDVSSRYVWRGLAFSQYPVLQPSARISNYGATLGLASSAYLGTEPGVEDTVSELDVTGNYTFAFGSTSLTPSIGAYFYPHAPWTSELGATLSQDLSVVVLMTRQALDIADNAGGWYGDVAAARSQPLGSILRLDASTSLGWGSGKFGRYYIDESIVGLHWAAAQIDTSLVLKATDEVYFRLHGTASHLLERSIRDLAPEANLLSGGLALGLAH